MLRSLRPRLVLSYVLLTVVAVSLAGALTLTLVRRSLAAQEAAHLQANAEAISRQAAPLFAARQPAYALDQLAATAAFLTETRVRILDIDQSVLADSGAALAADRVGWLIQSEPAPADDNLSFEPMPGMWLPLPHQRADALTGRGADVGPPGSRFIVVERSAGPWGPQLRFQPEPAAGPAPTLESREARVIAVPIVPDGGTLGYVELTSDGASSASIIGAIRDALLVAGLSSALIAGVVGLAVGNSLTGPLRRLATVAQRMGRGELSVRADAAGRDEIGALGRQLNQMAADLESSFVALQTERDALRQFIADASHELRTPLTALSNFNALLLGEAGDDPALRREFLGATEEQLARLARLTTHLLDLSRLDAGLLKLERRAVDGRDLVAAAARDAAPAAAARGVTLALELPDASPDVIADPARLLVGYANLVDNAIKFSPPGAVVTLGLDAAGTTFWVADQGPGIDDEHLPHVLKRFYRAATPETPGAGLGLAIADSVARAHGGAVALRNRPEGGLWAGLTLPAGQETG